MIDISIINNKICEELKKESTNVSYKTWLTFFQNAEFENSNIIVTVPNKFTKEILEIRFLDSVKSIYKQYLEFTDIIIKTDNINDSFEFKSADAIRKLTENNLKKDIDIDKCIKRQVEHIFKSIKLAASNGRYSTTCILLNELSFNEEIYNRAKDYVISKGYVVELNDISTHAYVKISW